MKLICVHCERSLVVVKNGATVVTMFDQPPRPYAIWSCDIWACPRCGVRVCAGFGMRPIAEHWQPQFAQLLTTITIHDYER
jgi:hypothetical protein